MLNISLRLYAYGGGGFVTEGKDDWSMAPRGIQGNQVVYFSTAIQGI